MAADNAPPLPRSRPNRLSAFGAIALTFFCWWVAGLTLTRLLYEWRFPDWLWAARLPPVLLVAAASGLLGAWIARRIKENSFAVAWLPLLLNLAYLVDPSVDPARGRFLFAAGLWLTTVLLTWFLVSEDGRRRWRWLGPLLLLIALLPSYLLTTSHAVGRADTFEFQVVAPRLGIAHPTGYPLYLLLGKLFSLLPVGSVAWRVNLASIVFALGAAVLVYRLAYDLLRRPLPALLGALALGFVPIFWSQAIVAEVYALHALLAALALWLMARLAEPPDRAEERRRPAVALAFVLGLSLTNHLTAVFLLPPAVLLAVYYLFGLVGNGSRRIQLPGAGLLLALGLAFALPLLLYAYLPIRWQAVNDEPMGFCRFVDWVIGGRFRGALQWNAWLRDPARFRIVGRLLLDAWGWLYLALAGVGVIYLFAARRRAALLLLVAAAGFTFYALNYYVPDLAVFLIPAHLIIAVFLAAGVAAFTSAALRLLQRPSPDGRIVAAAVFLICALPAVFRAAALWPALDQSASDGGETWGRGALSLPLAEGAAVLADSEKIAPLYYLQQIEGLRPDLDIMVLPDEAAYRAELDSRIAAGRPIYLARFLPGLEGVYHLRSAGPLVEVSDAPLDALPEEATPLNQVVGPLRLLGYRFEPETAVDPSAAGLTLYWTPARPLTAGEALPTLSLRWARNGEGVGPLLENGRHPVDNYYPINAWRPGEIVPDYHLLPYPVGACPASGACELWLEAAVAPRYTPAGELNWRPVMSLTPPATPATAVGRPVRAQIGAFALDGVDFPATLRPDTPLPLRFSGYRPAEAVAFGLWPLDYLDDDLGLYSVEAVTGNAEERGAYALELPGETITGRYLLIARPVGSEAGDFTLCGWLRPPLGRNAPTGGCVLGEVEIAGAPLPEGAANFADRIALLNVDLPQTELTPGGRLPVELTWQGLSPMTEDYTVFVQVLDAADRIVGQVDAWPVQGTYPTSRWRPGEIVTDPYVVQLSEDLPPGDYRLHIGLYLLATLERLPVVDEEGTIVNDKVEVGGLTVAGD